MSHDIGLRSAAGGEQRQPQGSGGPIGQQIPISPVSISDEGELSPSVAYNSSWQEYLVVWTGLDSVDQFNIYGQFVSHNGALISSRFFIPGFVGRNQVPDVAYTSDRNEYLVVWVTFGATGSCPRAVGGVRLDAYGTAIGAQFTLASSNSSTGEPLYPAVAYSTQSHKYLVVWVRAKVGTIATSGLEARILSGDGSTFGPVLQVTEQLETQPAWPDVAYSRARDEFLVVWEKWYDSTWSDHDIMGQRIGMAGGAHLEGANFVIHFTSNDETAAAVAWVSRPSGVGDYLVTCSLEYGGLRYVAGQLLTDAGVVQTGAIISPHGNTDWVRASAVAGNENTHEFLVAWRYDGAIQARRVTPAGLLGPYAESRSSGLDPNWPAVAGGPLGDYLVAYNDQYSGYPTDVFGFLWGNRVYLSLVVWRS